MNQWNNFTKKKQNLKKKSTWNNHKEVDKYLQQEGFKKEVQTTTSTSR
jgi:hypothetical protein